MECMPQGGRFSVIRLWCSGVPITDDPVTGETSATLEVRRRYVLNFESVHIQIVSCVLTATCMQFF